MQYYFGELKADSNHWVVVEALSFEKAKKIFKLGEIFPEKYIEQKWKNKKGIRDYSEYEEALYEHIHSRIPEKLTPKMVIPVYQRKDKKEDWKFLENLPLMDFLECDYTQQDSKRLLEGPIQKQKINSLITLEKEEKEEENELVYYEKLGKLTKKSEVRSIQIDIAKKKYEIEVMKHKLNNTMRALEKEIQQKKKVLFAIETYIEAEEGLVQIQQGEFAPIEEKLAIYQLKLYMDEEVGLITDDFEYEPETIDANNIEKFDKWVLKNYKVFMPRKKSITAWQVRRSSKHYNDNPIVNSMENQANWNTYLLIRNGDNFWRILSPLRIPETLFPLSKIKEIDKDDSLYEYHKKEQLEELKKLQEVYTTLALQLQGVFDFTNILSVGEEKLNLFSPNNLDKIDYIRNAESDGLLGDGHKDWYTFLKENRGTIEIGSRVVWYCTDRWRIKQEDRGLKTWQSIPESNKIYTITKPGESYFGTKFGFLYLPNDDVYSPAKKSDDDFSHKRLNRITFYCYNDELINIDTIDFRDIKYYLNTRLYRKDYFEMLSTMKIVYTVLKKEYEQETPFVLMCKGFVDKSEEEIRDAIFKWKVRVKYHRGILSTNEDTATRNIIHYLKTGKFLGKGVRQ